MKNKIKVTLSILLIGFLFYLYIENHQIWLKKIIEIQKNLIPLISQNFKSKDKVWLGITFLWCYGIFHSIGPGHGKAIILSTTISEKIEIKKIIILSGIIAYLQGLSALFSYKLFLLIGIKLIPALSFNLEDSSRKISAVLLIIVGIYFLYREFKNKDSHLDKVNKKNIYLTSFLIGIIPCSGILNILIFLKLLKIERYDFISVLSICSGMFFTLVFSGIFSSFISDKILVNKEKIQYVKYVGFFIVIIYGINFIN